MGFKELINPFAFMLSEKSFPYEEVAVFITIISLVVFMCFILGGFVFWAMPLELLRAIIATIIMSYIFNFITFILENRG